MRGLIIDRGYDGITLADVALSAGVGRTAVYNHFPDKESVLLAWAADETEQYLSRLQTALAGEDDPIRQLAVFLRMQMTELASHHTRLAGIGTALSAAGRLKMREHVAPMLDTLRDILRRATDAGILPQQDLAMTVSMISAITSMRYIVGRSGAELDQLIDAAIAFVRRGVGGPV